MSATLKEAEAALVEDFEMLADWEDRYDYIIGVGRALPEYPDALRTEDREVQGCQSRVWLDARNEEGRLHVQADSDALITKGLVAILVNLYSGRPPAEIRSGTLDFLGRIGLASHLTPSRVNGLHAMFRRIQRYAVEHDSSAG